MGKNTVEKYASTSNHYSVDVRTHQVGGGNVLKAICGIGMSKTQERKCSEF